MDRLTIIVIMEKLKLRVIKGGRITKRPPLIVNGKVVKPLLFVWQGGRRPKAS